MLTKQELGQAVVRISIATVVSVAADNLIENNTSIERPQDHLGCRIGTAVVGLYVAALIEPTVTRTLTRVNTWRKTRKEVTPAPAE